MSDPPTDMPQEMGAPAIPAAAKIGDASDNNPEREYERIIREILTVERALFFEKRNSKAERQRKLREVIERYTPLGGS